MSHAPTNYRVNSRVATRPMAFCVWALQYFNAVQVAAPQLLDNDAVWHKFAPVFRNDFQLLDTWAPPRDPEPLPVPLSVLGGRRDKLIGEDRLLSWQAFTTHFRGLEKYEGDHFYLMNHRQPLAAAKTAAMRSALLELPFATTPPAR
ncbi:thioesterase II family protein [Streptomyces sp. MS2.AVA.5]|uniref:Thioesterase domain-containing protein n=1 Tax=Streptomyces achmelvichensis TaxID=3134111 RepID=A0ACC6Q985_9ACTN